MLLLREKIALYVTFCCLLIGGANTAYADNVPTPSEYQIKAAFIYKFLNFIEWPQEKLVKEICIYGENPFGDTLERIIAVHDPGFARAKILKVKSQEALQGCNIIFVSHSEEPNLLDLIETLKAKPILTISDIRFFARVGGMIEFVLDGDRIRFIINQEQAKEAGLKISSQLLSLSKEVIQDS